ncbi:MAG: S16 family serine protease [Candidatus Xenobiia bacterium LiM19]
MIKNKDGGYLTSLADAFTETSPALVSAMLKRLFVDDNGDCAVAFVKGCADAVREARGDIIAFCLSRIDYLKQKIDYALDAESSDCAIFPSSMVKATLLAALAATELNNGSGFSLSSFTGHIKETLAALHISEGPVPDFIIDETLITVRERGELLDELSRAFARSFATASPSRGIWTGWIFRLIEYFLGHTRDCSVRRSVEVPVYYPGSKKGEVFTLVVEHLPGGTGAIFPHPVFTTPIVLSRDARDVIERVLRLILKQRKKKGFDDTRCDIMWYLKKAHCGSIVRSLQGASCGAGFALAISSLFDNEEIGHSLCVTGSVSPEGRILPIRAVRAKLAAVEQWSLEK